MGTKKPDVRVYSKWKADIEHADRARDREARIRAHRGMAAYYAELGPDFAGSAQHHRFVADGLDHRAP